MREAVIQRQDDEHPVFRCHTDDGVSLLDIGSIVPVCQKDTLRVGCGAGSVADVRIIIRAYRPVSLDEEFLILREELVTHRDYLADIKFILLLVSHFVKDDDLLYHRAFRKDLPYLGKLELGSDYILGIRMLYSEHQVV